MPKDTSNYSDILDLPDLPPAVNYKEVIPEQWTDHSVAWIGNNGFCKVKYRGKEYKNRVYNRRDKSE